MSNLRTLLFDLDGTLTDPKPGIVNCIRHAMEQLGHKLSADIDLDFCIGPPLRDSFEMLLPGASEARIEDAIRIYRERFADIGIFENEVCDGINEVVAAFHATGHPLYVATTKPKIYADRIIDHFGFRQCLPVVYGSELDGRYADKRQLLALMFEREGLVPEECVMIGDRKHDIEAAKVNGARSIGVMWGYGSEDELATAAPDAIAQTPADIARLIAAI